jgi:hypothetical protein
MKHRFSHLGFVVFAASLGLAAGALAQGFPTHFAPRCVPDELRVAPPSSDPCQPQIAVFGLSGPKILGRTEVDVEATGTLARDRGAVGHPTDRPNSR